MITMYEPQNNSPHTTLIGDIGVSDTTVTVADASVLPDVPNVLTIGLGEDAELVLMTAKTQNILTVQRGYNSTAAKAWESDEWIYRGITAQDIGALQENLTEHINDSERHLDGILPISRGGTGASSASGALSNLGAAPQSAVTSLTQQVEAAQSDAASALSAATAALPKSGGTLTGSVVAMTSPAEGTAQIRNAVVVASTVTDEEIESLSVPAGTIVFREE